MERVALYMRVSTEEQARHGLSLPEQEVSLTKYAMDHKMRVVGRYTDGGISGRKRYTKRPEMMRLLHDAEEGKIDKVLFIKLDRWFRSVGDYYEVQRILDDHRVTWQATQEDYETVTAAGRLKVNIMLSVAQDEADRTSERIKFVFEGKRARNEPPSGRLPKGYKKENKQVVLDPDVAPLVRTFFDTYFEIGSPLGAAKACPALGLDYRTARYMLSNPAYMGEFSGVHIPPIITPAEHNRILEMRRHTPRRSKQNWIYLFSGLLFCPVCGGRMGGTRKFNDPENPDVYYICCHHNQGCGCPNKFCYREDVIEKYLIDHIDSEIEALVTSRRAQAVRSYKSERDAVKRKLSRLTELYVNDMVSMDDYKKQYADLIAAQDAIPPDEPGVDVDALKNTFYPGWQDIYMDLPREAKRAFWRKALKKVEFSGRSVKDFILQ